MDGGCVWEENERRAVVIIPPSIFTLALSLRRYRDFSRSLLRRLIPTAGDLGVFTGRSPHWFIERSCAVGGRYPQSVAAPLGGATPRA
jgi:hypothetical protein